MGRPRVYQYENDEERKQIRRKCDREAKIFQYWKNTHGIIIQPEQMEEFMINKTLIKKIIPILDFIQNLETVDVNSMDAIM
jgi:hypothetical protein|tara:strand:+ start:427 stop:669 length:243 start_codon:yes stop_codon:yes gene_type:complete